MGSIRNLIDILRAWVGRQVSPEARRWFEDQIERLGSQPSERDLYLALGYATRRLGKDDLNLSRDDLVVAEKARPGWNPADWSIDQASRLAFLLASYAGNDEACHARAENLFRTADIGELIALYRGLPLYPAPELYVPRAREGARSAMLPIFEAVAHHNPFPREMFDENAWNQMVLKALFIGSRLDPIQGLDERANPPLMRMLCDYAHERWAAERSISPELWRCVGPFADALALADLERVITTGSASEQQAAALALHASRSPAAKEILSRSPDLARAAASGEITWAAESRADPQ